MFGCTPDVAQRQSLRDVLEIADYRRARAAIDLWKQGAKGIPKLVEQPALADMLVAMQRAMHEMDSGMTSDYTLAHLYAAMRSMPNPDDEG